MDLTMTDIIEKTKLSPDAPIGVFDSGMGGVRVLKDLVRVLPEEDFIYFGDSANAPYGTKTPEQIRELSVRAAEHLIGKNVKALVIACNTATSAAAGILRAEHPELPVIGIEPALKPAVTAFPGGNIVVMATPVTLKLEKFARLLGQFSGQANVTLLPVHGLVELIEQGITEGPEVREVLISHFAQYPGRHIDAVVLGCTHFPYVKDEIAAVLGGGVRLFDGGDGTARHLREVLEERGLLRAAHEETAPAGGAVTFLNSLQDVSVLEQMWRLFRS
ncbi:MAG: glutamate racemase [Lachnospiraceae bacterium]|nr:glutamate racemase [Lachnospiraceae bacterium]MBR0106372.1 glutamate racemase [Lachnospiraceae bacterium]